VLAWVSQAVLPQHVLFTLLGSLDTRNRIFAWNWN